jgi:electron transfer flavoprotein alpha subunit
MPNNILIIAQVHEGSLRKVSLELVTVAKDIAKGLGGNVQAVVIGSGVAQNADAMAKSSGSQVYLADDLSLQNAPEVYATVLANIIRQAQRARFVWRQRVEKKRARCGEIRLGLGN